MFKVTFQQHNYTSERVTVREERRGEKLQGPQIPTHQMEATAPGVVWPRGWDLQPAPSSPCHLNDLLGNALILQPFLFIFFPCMVDNWILFHSRMFLGFGAWPQVWLGQLIGAGWSMDTANTCWMWLLEADSVCPAAGRIPPPCSCSCCAHSWGRGVWETRGASGCWNRCWSRRGEKKKGWWKKSLSWFPVRYSLASHFPRKQIYDFSR